MQFLDRNWTVCAQTPAAGETMNTDDTLTFDTVKSSEGRPATTSRRRAAAAAAATTARTTPPLSPVRATRRAMTTRPPSPVRGMTGATTARPPSPVPGTTAASTPPAAPVHRRAAPTRPTATPARPRPHPRPRAARRRRRRRHRPVRRRYVQLFRAPARYVLASRRRRQLACRRALVGEADPRRPGPRRLRAECRGCASAASGRPPCPEGRSPTRSGGRTRTR